MYIENLDSLSSLMSIRHFKKDSRYVNDLYTLTYDNQESLYATTDLISPSHYTINNYDAEEDDVSFQFENISRWGLKLGQKFTECLNSDVQSRKIYVLNAKL